MKTMDDLGHIFDVGHWRYSRMQLPMIVYRLLRASFAFRAFISGLRRSNAFNKRRKVSSDAFGTL